MRVVVTGTQGQVARALLEIGPALNIEIRCVGRPEFDLAETDQMQPMLARLHPDVIVNAAAYTAVDRAEEEPVAAHAINAKGAGGVAMVAARLGVPIIQLSTDYVFDGTKSTPYVEADAPNPMSVYGVSKLAGEQAVTAAGPDHVILRTAWVYSPVGKNFVRTMLALAEKRHEVRVVADQWGCPTAAADVAVSVLAIARRLSSDSSSNLRGTFHLTGTGEASWAGFAGTIFDRLGKLGRRVPRVIPIPSSEYPLPARRPANSRLACGKMTEVYGLRLPRWQTSLSVCLRRLLEAPDFGDAALRSRNP